MLTENNERLPLTSATFRSGLQGRKLRHETSLIHPNALTQIAPADSAGNGEQNLHFWMSFSADLLCCLWIHGEKQYARGQQNLAQLPRWDAETGSRGVLSKEVASSSDTVWSSVGALHRGRILPGSCRVAWCLLKRKLLPAAAEVLLVCATPHLGRGKARPSLSCAALALITAFFVALKWNWINSFEYWKTAF